MGDRGLVSIFIPREQGRIVDHRCEERHSGLVERARIYFRGESFDVKLQTSSGGHLFHNGVQWPDGQLTPDQSQRAELWLRTHWSHSACPFHGPTRWEVGNVLAQAMAFSGGGLVVGGPVYPLVVVTCATCGYTVFVNAIKVGIVQAEPAAAQTPQPPELANG